MDTIKTLNKELLEFMQAHKGEETTDILCGKFASSHNLQYNVVLQHYRDLMAETKKKENYLQELEQKVRQESKRIELSGAVSTLKKWMPWEEEYIESVLERNPETSKLTVAYQVAQLLPHRSIKAIYQRMLKITKGEQDDIEDSDEEELLELGKLVSGVVDNITEFGAFISLPSGQRLLLHISEITEDFVSDIHDYLSIGDEVKGITILDNKTGRFSFSAKRYHSLKKRQSQNLTQRIPLISSPPPKPQTDIRAKNEAIKDQLREIVSLMFKLGNSIESLLDEIEKGK